MWIQQEQALMETSSFSVPHCKVGRALAVRTRIHSGSLRTVHWFHDKVHQTNQVSSTRRRSRMDDPVPITKAASAKTSQLVSTWVYQIWLRAPEDKLRISWWTSQVPWRLRATKVVCLSTRVKTCSVKTFGVKTCSIKTCIVKTCRVVSRWNWRKKQDFRE